MKATNYFHTEGVILKRQTYKESSILCRCLTREMGIIPIISTGAMKENSKNSGLIEPFNNLRLDLYRSANASIYTLCSAVLIERFMKEMSYQDSLLLNAAAELMLQVDFPGNDSHLFYQLFCSFCSHYYSASHHHFLLFLRFVFRLFEYLGIPFGTRCIKCDEIEVNSYNTDDDGLLCKKCCDIIREETSNYNLDKTINIDEQTAYVLKKLYCLNELKNYELADEIVVDSIKIILIHMNKSFHKNFHLTSLTDYRVT